MKQVCIVKLISSFSQIEADHSLFRNIKSNKSLQLIILNTSDEKVESVDSDSFDSDIKYFNICNRNISTIVSVILENSDSNQFYFADHDSLLNYNIISILSCSHLQLHVFGGKNPSFSGRYCEKNDLNYFNHHLLDLNNLLFSRQILGKIKKSDVCIRDIGRSAFFICESVHVSIDDIHFCKNKSRTKVLSLVDSFKYNESIGNDKSCIEILEHVSNSSWFFQEIGKLDTELATIFINFFSNYISTFLDDNDGKITLHIFQQQWLSSITSNNVQYMLAVLERIGNNDVFCLPLRSEDFSGRGTSLSVPNFSNVDEHDVLSSEYAASSDRALDYSLIGSGEFGRHRDGWNFVMQNLLGNIKHDQDAVGFDCFMEKTFVWNYGQEVTGRDKAWFGVTHRPHHIPDFYDWKSRIHFYQSPFFNVHANTLCGLITVSKDHADYLRTIFDIPIVSILHPTNHKVKSWRPDCLNHDDIKIVQIGSWLRKMHSIFRLPPGKYQKAILANKGILSTNRRFAGERVELSKCGKYHEENYKTVEFLNFLEDKEYDELLANNIVFLDMFSSTANNTVLECIARKTPIIVRRLPSTIEYLGEDYPLFFETLKQASELASDKYLLLEAHRYLVKRSALPDFHMKGFVDNFNKAIEKII